VTLSRNINQLTSGARTLHQRKALLTFLVHLFLSLELPRFFARRQGLYLHDRPGADADDAYLGEECHEQIGGRITLDGIECHVGGIRVYDRVYNADG
jgi:hypothetical protein